MYPFPYSADTYPAWPFLRVGHPSGRPAPAAAVALLNMPADSPVAKAARGEGWVVPHNDQPAHNCLNRSCVAQYKDFGELVFLRGLPNGPIVRLVELTVDEQLAGMAELLEHHATELTGSVIVTVSRGRIRIRRK